MSKLFQNSPSLPNPHSYSSLTPSRRRLRVVLIALGLIAIGVWLLSMPIHSSFNQNRRHHTVPSNLRQLARALNHNAENRGHYLTDIVDAEGEPLLSWRVPLLPYLDRQDLFRAIRRDEPWDSEHNRLVLVNLMIFSHPEDGINDKTRYLRPRMAGAILGPDGQTVSPEDIALGDGAANTILLIEAPAAQTIEWTRPGDWDIPPSGPIPGLSDLAARGMNAVFADGRVVRLPPDITADTLRALITYKGGESINSEALMLKNR